MSADVPVPKSPTTCVPNTAVSTKIADSKEFMADFKSAIQKLTGSQLEKLKTNTNNEIMQTAFAYFEKNGISLDILAEELRDDFSEEHCISVNDDKDADSKQLLLNSLEDSDNPYRAIFEVKKLDEGWDVLNLFDIVRLYETRQSSGSRISPATISEAQLIGRGARYCPFRIDPEQPKYQRKYDDDIKNELRICEDLFYHCQNDHRYVDELHKALREIGLDTDKIVQRNYILKDSFKNDWLYKYGQIFINSRITKSRKDVFGLPQKVHDDVYSFTSNTGATGVDEIMLDDDSSSGDNLELKTTHTTLGEIASINYAIVNKAMMKYPIFKFNTLKSYFPNLKSTREFIVKDCYLGGIRIDIKCREENPTIDILYSAVHYVLQKIGNSISNIEETYQGTKDFKARNIRDVFKNKTVNYTDPHDGGVGVSQNDSSVPAKWKIDLTSEEWFAYTDNFGTSEEKAFVAYIKGYIDDLKKKYKKVFLVRNEREFHLYSFIDGERFEPDYVLFLIRDKTDGFEQLQIFVEPKGTQLLKKDAWKEAFLLQMEKDAIPVKMFVDDNDYKIWGLHFFNQEEKMKDFDDDIRRLL